MDLNSATPPKKRANGSHAKQIAEMQRLTPRAAAWLCGVAVATLRDAVATLSPAEDGTYDAREVTKWANARMLSTVDDDDLEMVHRAVDVYGWTEDPGPLGRIINAMRSKYGRGADGWVVDVLLSNSESIGSDAPEELPRLSDEVLLARARESYEAERERRNEMHLNFSFVCECGRLRRGNRWIMEKPNTSEAVISSTCNKCSTLECRDPFKVQVSDLMD